jgi:DNA-binding LacI/PurR family transcriptional regulator
MPPSQRVTLLTIAQELGVSRTTVSNAYSRPDQLTVELRDKILATAERLGYTGPNAAARGLRTGRVGTIGLVFTDDLGFVFSDPNTALFMRGVAESTSEARVGLTLLPVHKSGPISESAVLSAPVDAYVIFSIADDHPVMNEVLRRGVPVAIVDEPDLGDRTSFVGIDDRSGARLAAEHIVALGHRKLGVLVHRVDDRPQLVRMTEADVMTGTIRIARERLAGYLEGIAGSSDAEITSIWQTGDLVPDAGQVATHEMLAAHPEITAILSMTDQLAIGACQALEHMGRSVPGDVSIVGYDDIPRAALWDPPLTTIRQPLVTKGRLAADMLLRQLNSGEIERTQLPIELVVRGSTAPVTG